jgi:hypothetical protein
MGFQQFPPHNRDVSYGVEREGEGVGSNAKTDFRIFRLMA